MNIWIDICHTPQYNFYKEFITCLVHSDYNIYITVLRRGNTTVIIERELSSLIASGQIHIDIVGRHRMTKWSAIIESNIIRFVHLFFWRLTHHIDIAFGNGMQPAMIQYLFRGKSYSFDDDPQTIDFKPKIRCNTECNFCLYESPEVEQYGAHVLRCLKEWAYLNPKTFQPNIHTLDKYGVQPKQYLFLREVSVGTFNYAEQTAGAILAVKNLIANTGMKVLFSLEEKNRRQEYPNDWILLQEPIEDIHSLIYFAAGLVSSGDSMAREAALLGIPSYYLGTRYSMPANLAASKVANLQNTQTIPFDQWLIQLQNKDEKIKMKEQEELRKKIDSEFIDINAYMMQLVEQLDGKHKGK